MKKSEAAPHFAQSLQGTSSLWGGGGVGWAGIPHRGWRASGGKGPGQTLIPVPNPAQGSEERYPAEVIPDPQQAVTLKPLIPSQGLHPHDLSLNSNHLPKAHLQTPAHGGLGLQHTNFEGTQILHP